jgi:hypothetical protein
VLLTTITISAIVFGFNHIPWIFFFHVKLRQYFEFSALILLSGKNVSSDIMGEEQFFLVWAKNLLSNQENAVRKKCFERYNG